MYGKNKFLHFHTYTAILEKVDSRPMLKTLKHPEFRWPVLGEGLGREYQWSVEQWSLIKTLAEMRNLHSKSILIRLYVSPDDKNSSHYIIKVRFQQFAVNIDNLDILNWRLLVRRSQQT